MTNVLVGTTYARVIDEVAKQCETTFEEEGVTRQTLDDLKKLWQKKLGDLKVASFPWEPPPVQPSPGPLPSNNTVPSNVPRAPNSGNGHVGSSSGDASHGGEVRIKNEPSESNGYPSLPQMPPNYTSIDVAKQRAAANLGQRFGTSAQAQIAQLQSSQAQTMQLQNANALKQSQSPVMGQQPRPAGTPNNVQLPQMQNGQAMKQYSEQARLHQQQQMKNLQAQHQQQRQQTPGQQQQHPSQQQPQSQQSQQPQRPAQSLAGAQTDGVADWDSYVAQRRQDAINPHLADATLRQQLRQSDQAISGGGFMTTLSSHPKTSLPHPPSSHPANSSTLSSLLAAQLDGPSSPLPPSSSAPSYKREPSYKEEDDDLAGESDEDKDAITSDLDDPDDNVIAEEEDDEGNGQIMVCTYDKVARVKNKWKCTLKDGVLTTGGKEYIFHKATGEFEW